MKNPVSTFFSLATFLAVPVFCAMQNPPIWIKALALIQLGSLALVPVFGIVFALLPAKKREKALEMAAKKMMG